MSSTIVKLYRSSEEDLDVVARIVDNEISSGLFAPEMVNSQVDQIGDAQVYFAVYEKYYMRNNSMACLTVQITSHDGVQLATVIGSAGGEGFLNISWGANEDFADGCVRTLKRLGFRE